MVLQQRSSVSGHIPAGARFKAFQHMQRMMEAEGKLVRQPDGSYAAANSASWSSRRWGLVLYWSHAHNRRVFQPGQRTHRGHSIRAWWNPLGGINSLWPLFASPSAAGAGRAVRRDHHPHQDGSAALRLVTLLPLVWLTTVTMTARLAESLRRRSAARLPRHAASLAGSPDPHAPRLVSTTGSTPSSPCCS